METLRLKLNMALHSYSKGAVITLAVHDGKPIDGYWNKRLIEAASNHCVEIVNSPTIKIKKPSKNTKELKDDAKST